MRSGKSAVEIGRQAEEIAARYLLGLGWELIERNFRTKQGEIDLIARDDQTLVFVEVKSNRQARFGRPEERVDERKQRQIARVAEQYLYLKQIFDQDCRFDVIALQWQSEHADREPLLQHYRNAFCCD
ncbi:MAG TPA: YraN family protein [bacterium]|jgi:putative endonuclease|nr:YraN family protein [bacterium]HNT65824.1 YraN family protein [bacterium]HOX85670.1 YraN family protein [bacterium]HPG44829.1 YraN family protein [bacterium]HPM98142.1 YraN family protein [bacterium]